jgi:dihydropteroate synthase
MGVVNVTPDSFSDGGLFSTRDTAIAHALELVAAGADILDIGGESTRPGAPAVTAAEEMDRVLPVIEALHSRVDVPISIDTTKSLVAEEALSRGATMVNDISGLTFDPSIGAVTARHDAALCVMHIQGTPRTMQDAPTYGDVSTEVIEFLNRAVQRAVDAGVRRECICVDPGIGFGKTLEHNLTLINDLGHIAVGTDRPVLAGVSRKSFLGALTGKQVQDRLYGTIAAVAVSVIRGAHIIRVHDVAEASDAVKVADALSQHQRSG